MFNQQNNFRIEIFDPTKHSWETIKEQIIFIEHQAFGDKSFSNEVLSNDFRNKNNVVVLLKDLDYIVAFVYAESANKEETALICDIVIEEKARHKHLVRILMKGLEEELRNRKYKYMEMDAAVANNYAVNISKHYKNRIIEQGEPHDSIWGQQVFFRIRL
jgi:ribosomal protein S18 acetylase RimI-like enzyme